MNLPQYGPVALAIIHERDSKAEAMDRMMKRLKSIFSRQNIKLAVGALLLVAASFIAFDLVERIANWRISHTQPAEQTVSEHRWRN